MTHEQMEIARLTAERNQARRYLADEKRAFAEIAAVHDEKQIELVATRKERDFAVAEAAGLLSASNLWIDADIHTSQCAKCKPHRGTCSEREHLCNIATAATYQARTIATQATAVLAAVEQLRYSVWFYAADRPDETSPPLPHILQDRLLDAWDAYRAALAGKES